MKKILLLSASLLLFTLANGQSLAERDSIIRLYRALPKNVIDSNRVLILNNLAFQYTSIKTDSSYILGQQTYDMARQINYPQGEARALNVMANAVSILGDYPKALKLYNQGKELAIKINAKEQIAVSVSNIADAYMQQGEWQKGLAAMREAFVLDKTISNLNPRLAIVHFVNIGECFYNLSQLDSALHYLKQGLVLSKTYHHPAASALLYLLGDVALAQKNRNQAVAYYRESEVLCIQNDDYVLLYEVYKRLSGMYEAGAAKDSAIHYAELSLSFAQKAPYIIGVLRGSQRLAALYKGKNDSKALEYFEIANNARDSIYSQEKLKQLLSIDFEEKEKEREIEAAQKDYQNRIRLYVLAGIVAVFIIIMILMYRNNRQRRRANSLLEKQKSEIDLQRSKAEHTLAELKSTQHQLIQSEKMASLGELTAGIAHEIQNPLNFVNNFSEVNTELIEELKKELAVGNKQYTEELVNDIKSNSEKINHHGKRAGSIVSGMLLHSRTSTGKKEPTDISALCDEYLRLAYHGLRAKDKSFNAKFETDFDATLPKLNVVPQDIGRVILNLINNAFYTVNEKNNVTLQQAQGDSYEPTVSVSTKKEGNKVLISVKDNGQGIPEKVKDKIFQPFFTTKPTGQGTGLGLSLAYDIVKAHGGELKVETRGGEGSEFSIQLTV